MIPIKVKSTEPLEVATRNRSAVCILYDPVLVWGRPEIDALLLSTSRRARSSSPILYDASLHGAI